MSNKITSDINLILINLQTQFLHLTVLIKKKLDGNVFPGNLKLKEHDLIAYVVFISCILCVRYTNK